MTVLSNVGPQTLGDGAKPPLRSGRDGDLVASNLHGFFYEQAFRKNIFCLDSDSLTVAAAHATKGAIGTAKFINGFLNPKNSGKNAAILAAVVATVSGTPAGPLFWNYQFVDALSNAEAGNVRSSFLSPANTSAMRPHKDVVLSTNPANTSNLIQLATFGGPAAVAAGAGAQHVMELVDGRIIVPPGTLFGICATGAGTSHVLQSTLWWEEADA